MSGGVEHIRRATVAREEVHARVAIQQTAPGRVAALPSRRRELAHADRRARDGAASSRRATRANIELQGAQSSSQVGSPQLDPHWPNQTVRTVPPQTLPSLCREPASEPRAHWPYTLSPHAHAMAHASASWRQPTSAPGKEEIRATAHHRVMTDMESRYSRENGRLPSRLLPCEFFGSESCNAVSSKH